MRDMVVEVCVDSVESALAAEAGGAGRIEICDNLQGGGTTPSLGMVKTILDETNIEAVVLIRPRTGDFFYTPYEIEVMRRDIEIFRNSGVDGVVMGALTPDGDVHTKNMKILMKEADSMKVTFHRAFDMCRDFEKSLEDIIELKIDRILTSGGEASAFKGKKIIENLIEKSRGRVIIMAGAGIKSGNLEELLQIKDLKEVHLSGKHRIESSMKFKNQKINMGGSIPPSEYEIFRTDEEEIKKVVKICREGV